MSQNNILRKFFNSLRGRTLIDSNSEKVPQSPQSLASSVPLEDELMWPAQPFSIPIPNAILREASSIAQMDAFFAIGEAWAQLVSYFLPTGPVNLLDIGCGCGKQTRFFYLNPNINYVGIDIYLPAIEWCRRAFAQLGGRRFHFEHFDGYSKTYNPNGKIKTSEYILPVDNCSINMVVCASLFTHLLEPDCIHYLMEIRRVLKPSGRSIISIHTQPAPDKLFSGDEARIDIDKQYFTKLAHEAGLNVLEEVGVVYGQHVFVLEVQR